MNWEQQIAIDKQRTIDDALRYKELDENQCQLCHAEGPDKRSLFISCLYAVHEVVSEVIDLRGCDESVNDRGYYLRICKSCRSRLLTMLGEWRRICIENRELPKDHDGHLVEVDPDANIPVRINGAIRMMTLGEYERWSAVKESRL